MRRNLIALGAALLLALVLAVRNTPPVVAVTWDCGLLQDCGFDNFYGDAGAGSGPWKVFKTSGASGLSLIQSDGWPSGPSLKVSGDVPFESGVYQQVPVTPGNGYTLSLAYAVVNINGGGWHEGDQVNRRLGIDPNGGTNPSAGSVTWSGDYFARGKFDDDVLQVSEYAKSPTITVFIRVINPYGDRHVDVFIDAAKLVLNSGMAPIQVTAPTATRPPTAVPPTAAPATARPTRAPATPAPVATDVPTDIPATDKPAAAADALASPTTHVPDTPTRIPTRVRRTVAPAPTSTPDTGISTQVLAISAIGITSLCGVGVALVLLGIAFWYWRRSKKENA